MKYTENQILAKIAAYCSKAERCEYEVKQKLIKWEVDNILVQKLIIMLKKEKFLDETRYCQAFIKDKIQFNKWGKVKIMYALTQKRISEKTIQQCFEEIESNDFNKPLIKILSTKIKSIKSSNNYEKQNKLIRFALGRGYTFDQIKNCLRSLNLFDDDENFESNT